jgi:hypothetical protein
MSERRESHHWQLPLPPEGSALGRPAAGQRPLWFYVGRVGGSGPKVFVVDRWSVDALEHCEYRSPARFAWGPAAPWTGRAELAFALLVDATGRRPPEAATFAFFRDVVGCLPRDGFVLSDVDLDVWIDVGRRPPIPSRPR